jgi:potassium efflux system protein
MDRMKPRLLIGCLMVLAALPVAAQTAAGQEEDVDLSQLRRSRAEAERDQTLADGLRTQILELYDVAISALEKAEDNRAAITGFERERDGVDRVVASLKSELEQPEPPLLLPLPKEPTVEQAEDALARERARLAANRSALLNQQRIAEDRAKTRSDISQRLGELDLEIELLNDELRQQVESTARTELKVAARLSLLARREAARSEIDMFRARLALLNKRSSLIPLETDLAQRRFSHSQALVNKLEGVTHELRIKKARESLGEIQDQCRQLAEELPMLAPLAAETVELAETLWSADGLIAASERIVKSLDSTRHHQAQLNHIADLTGRKFEAYGRRGSVVRWWPDIPEDFPEPGTVEKNIEYLGGEIPEVEHRLIVYEQLRAKALDLARNTMLDIETELGKEPGPELKPRVRDLLSARQDLLDELIERGGRYSNQLIEYRTAEENFLNHVRDVERFLYSHLLWSRSVPRPIIPRLHDIGEAAGWLLSTEHLDDIAVVGIEFTGSGVMAALVLVLLVLLRRPLRSRVHEHAERVADPERDSVGSTLAVMVLTVLLAAPLPIVLFAVASLINRMGNSTYWHASAEAFFMLASAAAVLELLRQIFAPDGLAEAHNSWPTHATRPLYRGLVLTEVVGLSLLFPALHFAFAGMRLDSPKNLQLYNNSLGRVAFVAAMLVIGLSILAMLRPEKKDTPGDQDLRVSWPRRFSEYAFPTAFLGAYPIIAVATVVPALLAATGFYVTGMLLAYQMLRTVLLAAVVLVVGGLFHRWRIVSRNRSLLEAAEHGDEKRERLQAEFETAERQMRQLHRFGIIVALAIGLSVIWSDALPLLQLAKRVQILPQIEILEPQDETAASLGVTDGAEPVSEESADDSGAAAMPGFPPVPGAEAPDSTKPTPSTPLTLWQLFEAILAGVFTLVLVKNMPGAFEVILRRRTTLDAGALIAFSTLIRYSITIVGTIVVFALLGVTWDKVQWLAAALTFGLAFGLQEIVANFVSGLILLVERPVRVGDVVTIGNLMGTVTRIQIRATTITLWDRSEMIVPNKEFITTKLVNWTLSDSKRRIEIPLRIAYGTDLELVKELLVDAAKQHPSVLDDPNPHVLLLAFGDDAVNLELRFVVDFGQGLTTKDQVQMEINRVFREHGIEFALPKSEVRFISEGKGAQEKIDPTDDR